MSLANTPIRDLHPVDAGVEIRQRIWPHLNMEFAAAAAARAVFGQAAQVSAECASLVALPLSGKIAMIEFDQQGAPEVKTDELPFVSIGSGQPIADPFLAFLRQVFWKTRKPSTLDGVFAAHWTLQHAIRTNPGGIGGGVQIVVLTDGDCKAHELTPNELVDHHEAWSGAEEYLSRYRETLHGKMKGVSVPEPPSPAGGPPDLPDPQTP